MIHKFILGIIWMNLSLSLMPKQPCERFLWVGIFPELLNTPSSPRLPTYQLFGCFWISKCSLHSYLSSWFCRSRKILLKVTKDQTTVFLSRDELARPCVMQGELDSHQREERTLPQSTEREFGCPVREKILLRY